MLSNKCRASTLISLEMAELGRQHNMAIDALRAALAQQQAEPVATCFCGSPQILNTWHRKDGPCLPKAEPVQAEPVGEIYRRAAGAACGSSMTQAESGNPSF
jgi:hypothetical protein